MLLKLSRVLALFSLLLLASLPLPTQAQEAIPFVAEIKRDIESHLDKGLPDPSEIIPGYHRPPALPPSLVIGNFDIVSTDEIPWGSALGQILRWRIPFGPHLLARIPHAEPDRFRGDLHIPDLSQDRIAVGLDAVAIAYPRLGIENALVGQGTITATSFTLTFELYSLPSRQVLRQFEYSGALSGLPGALDSLVFPVLEEIGVKLDEATRAYLAGSSASSFEELRSYGEFLVDASEKSDPEEELARVVSIWKGGIRLAGFVPLYCYALYLNRERLGEEINEHHKEILERFKGHPAVEGYVYRMWYTEEGDEPSIDYYSEYLRLVKDNPLDIIPLVRLGNLAFSTKHDPYSGLALSLQAVECFPMNYRSWWSLSSDLMTALQLLSEEELKGDLVERWRNYSRACFERALALHPVSPDLLQDRLWQVVQTEGLSEKAFGMLEKIVENGQRSPQYLRNWYNQIPMMTHGGDDSLPKIRLASIATRFLPEDPGTSQLFAWAEGALEVAELQGSLDNMEYCKRAEELTRIANVLSETRRGQAYTLNAFLRSGLWDKARVVARKQLEDWKANAQGSQPSNLDMVEIALFLEEGGLAEEWLSFYSTRGRETTPNSEDYLAALKALIPAARGDSEESRKALEARIGEAEDNLYSRLRYVQLSLTHPVDAAIWEECLKYLIDYAPEEIEYGDDIKLGVRASESEAPRYYQDLLRWVAKGHRARAEGNHAEALEAYQRATLASNRISHMLMSSRLRPYLFVYRWSERLAVAGITMEAKE